MSAVLKFLRGTAEIRLPGTDTATAVNQCAGREISFWDVHGTSGETEMTIYACDVKRLLKIFENAQVRVRGMPAACKRLKNRWWLIFAASLCVIVFWTLSHFVWDIQVVGNEKVKASEIMRCLEKNGVKIGSFGLTIDSEALANHMLRDIPELSWLAVNITGSRAQVLVRERVMPPDIVDDDTPTAVFAEKDAIILEINVYDGTRLKNIGDTVQRGEMLVSGVTGSFAGGIRTEHAMAYVKGRTWYEYTAKMPALTMVKEYTGKKTVRYTLDAAGHALRLYFDGGLPYGRCDAVQTETRCVLPGGAALPLSIVRTEYTEYVGKACELSRDECAEILKAELSQRLRDDLGGGEIIAADFEISESGGVVSVTLRAECRERIDTVREMTQEELADGVKREESRPQW